jgi:hypothetical protein
MFPDSLMNCTSYRPSHLGQINSKCFGTGYYVRTAERDIFVNVNTSDRVVRRGELTKYDRVILEVLQRITTCGFQSGSRLWPCRRIGESLLDVIRYGDTIEVPFGGGGGGEETQ